MDADVALLQEVGTGPAANLPHGLETGGRAHWDSYQWATRESDDGLRKWRNRWPVVVKLSDRVKVEWLDQVGPDTEPTANEISVSDVGLIAAARVTPMDPLDGEPFIAASIYAHWDSTSGSSRTAASVTADLSALIHRSIRSSDRILAAGDLNDWYGWGAYSDLDAMEPVDTVKDGFGYLYRIYLEGDRYTVVQYLPNGDPFGIQRRRWKTLSGAYRWISRDMETCAGVRLGVTSGLVEPESGVWDRFRSIGLEFMGPQFPNGRRADPVPDFMPSDTENVVTFRRPGQPIADADQQLDYVFASCRFHENVTARALNAVEEWGASDHCRLLIEVAGRDGRGSDEGKVAS